MDDKMYVQNKYYHATSIISQSLIGNRLYDHMDVDGAALVGPNYIFILDFWLPWIEQRVLQDKTRNIWVLGFGATYIRGFMEFVCT